MKFFAGAVSVYFENVAGILLSFHNTINEHRYSAIFTGDVGCLLITCLDCASKTKQKKNILDYKHRTEPLDR